MYKLYYSPGACSKAPHVALHETGAKHQLVRAHLHGATQDPALLAVNPRHQVPVLDDDGTIVREGAAILIYLLDKEKSPLLPSSGPERAHALEWLCFFNASVHPVYGTAFAAQKIYGEGPVSAAILEKLQPKIQKFWDDTEQHLSKNKYLAGNNPSVADILMTVIGQWNPPAFKSQPTKGPNTQRAMNDIMARPSWKEATAMEQDEQKEAA